MSSTPPPTLAPRVFLAFDDFSRAGKRASRLRISLALPPGPFAPV